MPRGVLVSRIKIVQSCSINAPWKWSTWVLSVKFASSRPKLDQRIQAEDLRSEGAMFGPKILVWAEYRIILGSESLTTGFGSQGSVSSGPVRSWASQIRVDYTIPQDESNPDAIRSLVDIDSSVIVESAGLAVSSVGINSTAARTVGYLSKSRSRRISGSLLIGVILLAFSAKAQEAETCSFLGRNCKTQKSAAHLTQHQQIYSLAELGRRVGTPRIHRRK
ncbi:hypothetical protein ACFXTO_047702 [Malus domestica]